VEQYFVERGLSKTGNWRMVLKTAIILGSLATSYVLLVFFSASLLMAVITALAISQIVVLIGFNIMHDSNHGSYSKSKRLNRLMGFTMDLIGGSHLLWRQKHNILHHTYTNIHELDDDLNSTGLLRLSPDQRLRPWHRFQHFYALPIYSLLTLSWVTYTDFKKFFSGRIGSYQLREMSASEGTLFFLTKIFYFVYMIGIPLLFHPVLYVLIAFVAIHLMVGLTFSVTEWAIHQVETTANFAPKNRFAAWYLGGLNFQIEHHLFPEICHMHYPKISKIVKETCRDFSIAYVSYPTVRSAIAGHYRFLRTLGSGRNTAMADA
jgi:linoleoyl-CoA desaturase